MTNPNGDVFPIEIECEEALLATVLIFRENAWARLEFLNLTPASFFRVHHQWIFEAISKLFSKGASVDLMSVQDALGERLYEIPDGPVYLTKLIGRPVSLSSINYYAEKVRKAEYGRNVITSAGELARLGSNLNGKGSDRIKQIANQILADFESEKPTHDVLRDRYLSSAGQLVYGLGDFRRYKAGLWPIVPELTIKREVSHIVEAAKVEGVRPSAAILSSVTELTRIQIAMDDDSVFDSQPDYLVCGNGTLHIPTLSLADHQPELYATSGVSYDYDPSAQAPAWDAFLFDLAEKAGPGVAAFLQEFSGYALTTDTSYELSIWLYGPPGSGKSTFLTGLETMLESRAGLLGLADIVNSRFALANLPGKTLAISTEQPGDYIASTHILNAIISGESIMVERKFLPAIRVTSRCKLAWAMNELPRVSDPNSGIFRRVKVVEFPKIAESDRDPRLKEAIKREGPGILNWALAGLNRFRARGRFEIPGLIMDATQDFRNNNDIPARFVEECCVTGNDQANNPYRTQSSQLYDAYRRWCDKNGHRPQSSTSIAENWKRLGFEKRRPGGINHWFYVGLRGE